MMAYIDVEGILLLVSATLFLSYLSDIFYTKTKIPDVVWLLSFGYILGPILQFFDKELFLKIFPFMILVTIAIFSFDTGINVDVSTVMRTLIKALTLTITSFVAITIIIGLVLNLIFPDRFNLLEGMLLGAMIGGIGGISVSGIVDQLKSLIPSMDKEGIVLNLESTLSDPIRLVISLTLIKMIMLPGITLENSMKDIVFTFTISSILGFAFGMVWAEVLNLLRGRPFNYMMTVASLFPAYIISEQFIGKGGGPITALAFGLTITNYSYFSLKLGSKRKVRVDKRQIREFNLEITFLIKAFFFVYLGLIVSLTVEYALMGLGIVALMLAIRYIIATGVGNLLNFSSGEKVLSRLIFLQGTSALVMAQLPILQDSERVYFSNPKIYGDLCFPIVLITIVFVSIIGPIIARQQIRRI